MPAIRTSSSSSIRRRTRSRRPGRSSRPATTPASPARPTARSSSRTPTTRVRVTDAFMQAVVDDEEWTTHAVVARRADGHLQGPRRLPQDGRGRPPLRRPGHPVRHDHQRLAHLGSNTDRIHASNPCSEYMFLNDTACNLASLNLMKFVDADGEFDVESYRYAAKLTLTAQEILVDNASLPDAADRGEQPQVPAARPGLRQPRRAADEPRPRLRLRRGPQLRGRPDRDHARRGVQAVAHHRPRPRRPVRRRTTENREPFLRVINKHRDAAYRDPDRPGRPEGHDRHAHAPSTTRRSSSARTTATATPRSPCSRRPARSRS